MVQDVDKGVVRLTVRKKIAIATAAMLAAILVGLSSNFAYDAIKAFGEVYQPGFWGIIQYAVGAAVCGVVFWLLTYFYGIPAVRKALLESSARIWKQDDAPKSRVIINALSLFEKDDQINMALAKARAIETDEEKLVLLNQLCDPKGEYEGWSWQQPMRLLRHNYDKLEVLYTMLTDKSEVRYESFRELVSLLARSDSKLEMKSLKINEEQYTEVYKDISSAIRECCNIRDLTLKDICIDITSGTREYSAAATVITLNSDALFSYVQTKGKESAGEVVIYNASVR